LILALSTALPLPAFSFTQDVYVWQRAWTDAVQAALTNECSSFTNVVVLAAEISWKNKQPVLARVPLDYPALKATSRPVGIALRIGTWPGPFDETNPATVFAGNVAANLVDDARKAGVGARELQLDFDCAESKLEGYTRWVKYLKTRVSPVPLTITTLPSWLNHPSFDALIQASDGYVLQVHSFERPKSSSVPFKLCDPAAARAAVQKAAQYHTPFRVALPTYGYDIAFDKNDHFIGLSAEGTPPIWPAAAQVRHLRSDPLEMAALSNYWQTNTPRNLQGIIWYRLPIKTDTLNWRWPTLRAILAGQSLRENIRAELRRVEPGLMEVHLVNDGELDFSSRLAIEVRWSRDDGTRLVAGDALRGFEFVEAGPSAIQLRTSTVLPLHLSAGDRTAIGWLRLSKDREAQLELKKL
jgi:hypothetical protein